MSFLPLFPIELAVFPGQHLPLHIFEPRYKQLLGECRDDGITFGIAATVNGRLAEYGAELRLVEVFKTYETGEMDVLTRGIQAFRIQKYIRDVPDKMYSAAEIDLIENDDSFDSALCEDVLEKFHRLHKALQNKVSIPVDSGDPLAFTIGHHVGFSLPQKVQLLSIARENDRLEFIREHVDRTLPGIEDAARLKLKIGGNGHVKQFPRV